MLYNSANELVNEKVWGKNVTVYYDKVFKSYKMEFENEDGKIVFYKFTLIRDLGNDMKLMQTPEGLTVTIIDKLANGGLFIKNEKFDDGTTLYYATSKATKLN